MAARRVSLGYLSTAVLLSVGAAVATFQLKYAVRNVEGELATVRAQIAREREVVQSARADLAYLTRPDRLVMQAAQLGMVPARGERLLAASQLPAGTSCNGRGCRCRRLCRPVPVSNCARSQFRR